MELVIVYWVNINFIVASVCPVPMDVFHVKIQMFVLSARLISN